MRFAIFIILLATTASCVSEPGDDATDESVSDEAVPLSGTARPPELVCDGTLCWDQEWNACDGYNYRGRVYLSRTTGQYKPYYSSVTQYTGDKNHTRDGLDWQIFLKNDNGLLGATTYHNDDDTEFGSMPLYNFDPPRSTHPYVEFLAGKSEDHKGSCWFRIYLYGSG